MQQVQNVESVDIQIDCETTCKKRTDSSSVFTHNGKVESINMQNDHETTSRKLTDKKRKQICSVSFQKVFKFQVIIPRTIQKNF